MKTCDMVKDLIPLYAEGLTSEESNAWVERHIAECPDCKSYYEMIRQDYDKHRSRQPVQEQLDRVVARLAKYQRNIKLAGVLAAMLLSCIISGAGVEFLSTLPLIILIPFLCQLYYDKTLPIIGSALPFGILGAMLNEQDASYIPFFAIIAVLTASIGVGAGRLVKLGIRQLQLSRKILLLFPAAAILFFSCTAYFSFFGNPVGYLDAMIRTKNYVNQTYDNGILAFKGVSYNFKDNRHYGRFEYVLNGTRQIAPIGIMRNGEVNDHYQYMLQMQFSEERSADVKTEIAAAINYRPITIFAKPEAELHVTRDELNHRYYNLSYDPARRDKATALRQQESGKLRYEISFGAFSGEYDSLTKDEFLQQSAAILHALKERQVPYHSIEMKAADENGRLQSVNATNGASVQQLIDRYQLLDSEK